MNLDGALSIATGGLANVNRQMALVSQNVANASTPGYAAEIATQTSVTADGAGPRRAQRPGDPQPRHDAAGARCSARTRRSPDCRRGRPRLQAIDAVQGTPGQGSDIASLLGNLQDQFSTC